MNKLDAARGHFQRSYAEARRFVSTASWTEWTVLLVAVLLAVVTCWSIITHKSDMCARGAGGPHVVP